MVMVDPLLEARLTEVGGCAWADMGRKMKGPQREELSTVVVDRIRRRLRQNGFRCHITLQVSPPPPPRTPSLASLSPESPSQLAQMPSQGPR